MDSTTTITYWEAVRKGNHHARDKGIALVDTSFRSGYFQCSSDLRSNSYKKIESGPQALCMSIMFYYFCNVFFSYFYYVFLLYFILYFYYVFLLFCYLVFYFIFLLCLSSYFIMRFYFVFLLCDFIMCFIMFPL